MNGPDMAACATQAGEGAANGQPAPHVARVARIARFVDGAAGPLEVISYTPATRRAGPPLLFVHGAFTGAWSWDEYFLPWFAAQGFSAHALSLRGHCASAGGQGIDWVSVADYTDDVMAVAEDLALRGEGWPILIGHSMGGFIVQKCRERASFPGVALVCAVPPQGLMSTSLGLALRNPGLLLDINRLMGGGQVGQEVMRDALFAQDIPEADLARYYTMVQPESTRAIWDMSLFALPVVPHMQPAPMLVLGAEFDNLVPAHLVRLTGDTYGVAANIFPGMGHGLMLEPAWRDVAQVLADWALDPAD